MTARRGRGRPTVFEPPTQTAYLDLLRHGFRLGDAAERLGISRVVPTRYARTDREFAAAVEEAKTVGAKVRRENVPHDEYRYNVLKCRCPVCTRAATVARAGRRAEATTEATAADESPAETAGDIHPIRLNLKNALSAPTRHNGYSVHAYTLGQSSTGGQGSSGPNSISRSARASLIISSARYAESSASSQ
ncbi:hypothetical protein OG582_40390 (plasmid) [Streptomyces anulatus]|uniref:hypothetical protein n=1 Tax=Streptomyces anulatus TaxID=1892 RepID=UPI00325063BB